MLKLNETVEITVSQLEHTPRHSAVDEVVSEINLNCTKVLLRPDCAFLEDASYNDSNTGKIGAIRMEELYKRHPILIEYSDVFCLNDNIRIMGEGSKGLVLSNERTNIVGKIPLCEENESLLSGEIENHNKFYEAVHIGRKQGFIPKWFKVPRILNGHEGDKLLILTEKIEGHSLTTYWLIDYYSKLLPGFSEENINDLTDYEIKLLLERKYKRDKMELDSMILDIDESLTKFLPEKLYGFKEAIDYLKSQGIVHGDLHSGNVIIDKNGNLFIIDFDT